MKQRRSPVQLSHALGLPDRNGETSFVKRRRDRGPPGHTAIDRSSVFVWTKRDISVRGEGVAGSWYAELNGDL